MPDAVEACEASVARLGFNFWCARCALRNATPVSPRRHPVQAQCGEVVASPFEMQNCQEGTSVQSTKRGKQRAGSAKLVPGKICVDAKKKRRPLPCHHDDHGNVAHWGVGPSPAWSMEQGAGWAEGILCITPARAGPLVPKYGAPQCSGKPTMLFAGQGFRRAILPTRAG